VFAGLARILAYLPEDHHMRPKYLALYRDMAASLAGRQGRDGLWRMNLDDAEEYPQPETSGTGFFCYGFAWGVNHGVLDRDRYLPVARKAWEGLVKNVSPEGKVRWGQPVGASPYEISGEDTHEYVTGTFLLAASEIPGLGVGDSLGSPRCAHSTLYPISPLPSSISVELLESQAIFERWKEIDHVPKHRCPTTHEVFSCRGACGLSVNHACVGR